MTIPAGSSVLIGYAAANRDDRVFDAPARFDLDRDDATKHLTFGFGTHFCMGAPLARRELLFGFEALVGASTRCGSCRHRSHDRPELLPAGVEGAADRVPARGPRATG